MIEIASLITLCKTVLAGSSKVLGAYKKKKLSDREESLLIAASQTGKFVLFSSGQKHGVWVSAGGETFLDENDPAHAAHYVDAFRSLCERGYIDHQGGNVFILTGSGFDKARKLSA